MYASILLETASDDRKGNDNDSFSRSESRSSSSSSSRSAASLHDVDKTLSDKSNNNNNKDEDDSGKQRSKYPYPPLIWSVPMSETIPHSVNAKKNSSVSSPRDIVYQQQLPIHSATRTPTPTLPYKTPSPTASSSMPPISLPATATSKAITASELLDALNHWQTKYGHPVIEQAYTFAKGEIERGCIATEVWNELSKHVNPSSLGLHHVDRKYFTIPLVKKRCREN